MKNIDAIIVGQGISGTILSAEFLKNGKTCVVIDNETEHTSSKVSGGVYNPIVFKRIVKSWMVDDLLPIVNDCYKYIEDCCQQKFHIKRRIIKVFVNDEEKELWLRKTNDSSLEAYLDKEIQNHNFDNSIKPHHGLAYVNHAGSIYTRELLSAWCNYLKLNGSYENATFNYNDIEFTGQQIKWKDYVANYLIFCEGYAANKNPFFPNLPFVPAKGEVLTVNIKHLDCGQDVLNKGVFILPQNDNTFKVGATYVWDKINSDTTPEALSELSKKLEKVLQTEFKVIGQEAGIRPSTKDRRPLVGRSKQHANLLILNGMGTKAVLLAPYFSKQLFEHIYFKKNIHPEANINRFY